MTSRQPPKLALALLERFVPGSEALAGDLVEEFEARCSLRRFWWQVICAIATAWLDAPAVVRPLVLVELQPVDAIERARSLDLSLPSINLSASPLNEVGGLGIVVLLSLLTVMVPEAWWIEAGVGLAGVLLGLALIVTHRPEYGCSANRSSMPTLDSGLP